MQMLFDARADVKTSPGAVAHQRCHIKAPLLNGSELIPQPDVGWLMGAGAKSKKLVEKLKHQFPDRDICSNQNVAPVACLIGMLTFPSLPFYHFPN